MSVETEDMEALDDLCERYEIRRNQRISTLMDEIDAGAADTDDDDDDDADSDRDDED